MLAATRKLHAGCVQVEIDWGLLLDEHLVVATDDVGEATLRKAERNADGR
jgi:hypothetical protein